MHGFLGKKQYAANAPSKLTTMLQNDRDLKLKELDYMKETHLLIDSIRETVTQLVAKKQSLLFGIIR